MISRYLEQIQISHLGLKIWIVFLSSLIVFSIGYFLVSDSALSGTAPFESTGHISPVLNRLPLFAAAAFTGITTVLVYHWFIATRLAKLTKAAQELGAGDYASQIELEGPTEVRNLAAAFNDMAARLAENLRQRDQLQKSLEELAITDDLTGVYNRRELNRLLDLEFRRAKRFKRPLAMIIYDIDHFKRVNDSYGHLIGDQVLIWLTNLIAANTRSTNFIARYGGDEFVILLPETSSQNAFHAAERLRKKACQVPFQGQLPDVSRVEFEVSISLGVAELKEEYSSVEEFFSTADQAMYTAKNSGRNQTQIAASRITSNHL